MTRLRALSFLLLACPLALAQSKPGDPGYVPPEVREDPLTNALGLEIHGFLTETQAPIKLSKLWGVAIDDFRNYLLAESSATARERGLALSAWAAGFGAGGSQQGQALMIHVFRCEGPAEAGELLQLLRKNFESKVDKIRARLAEQGLSLPPVEDLTLEQGVAGFAFDGRPDLGKQIQPNRSARLGFTTGRVVVYCDAMNNYGSASLTDLARKLLTKIQADEAARASKER